MHFTLVRLTTPNMPDTRVFDDVLLPLKYAFERLGYQAETRVNSFNPKSRNICLGANYDPEQKWHKLPDGAIIFNLEQLEASGYPWQKTGGYLDLLKKFEVWDFSLKNIDFLISRNIKAAFLPLGYVPEMSRLTQCSSPTTDVLFYGALTPRRRRVLDALDGKGLKVIRLEKAFADDRDQALYDSKMLINIHHSLPASLEIVRLGYALANERAVVSELNPDTYHYPELSSVCAYGQVDELAGLAEVLSHDVKRREKIARQGFEAFKSLKLEDSLAGLVGRRQVNGSTKRAPEIVNLGSGERFLDQAINIDSNPLCRPDLVLNFPDDRSKSLIYQTERFGKVCLGPASFSRILLVAALAAAEDREKMLAACHNLLADSGQLLLTLPFNAGKGLDENSFYPYVEHGCFDLEGVDYLWTERGRMLEARGADVSQLRKVEGAFSNIRLRLKKKGSFISLGEIGLSGQFACHGEPRYDEQPPGRSIYYGPASPWLIEDVRDEAGYLSVPPFPPLNRMRRRLIGLGLKRIRYRLNLKLGLSGRHDRYREKLAQVEKEMADLRRLFAQ